MAEPDEDVLIEERAGGGAAPIRRRPANFEASLERTRGAIASGRLTSCGQDAISDLTGVSTKTARKIQSRLEAEGLLIREGAKLKLAQAAA